MEIKTKNAIKMHLEINESELFIIKNKQYNSWIKVQVGLKIERKKIRKNVSLDMKILVKFDITKLLL